jgi:hypothetical protein
VTTTRIIVLLNLKPGKNKGDYEAWAKNTDLATVNTLGSVEKFTVFAATGLLGSNARPPFDYIEILDVVDMDAFGRDVATPVMQRVAAEFQDWAEPVFILTRNIEDAA